MERIETLISKLKEQFDQNADPAQLLATVQQLQNELSQLQPRTSKTLGTSKVAVMMPSGMNSVPVEYEKYLPKTKPAEEKEIIREVKEIPVMEVRETKVVNRTPVSIVNDNGQLDMAFDPMTEIPTLSHQVMEPRVETTRQTSYAESLNDKLKQEKTELFEILKETP